jgi:hypothetical protein
MAPVQRRSPAIAPGGDGSVTGPPLHAETGITDGNVPLPRTQPDSLECGRDCGTRCWRMAARNQRRDDYLSASAADAD